jgi:hypothetical protein
MPTRRASILVQARAMATLRSVQITVLRKVIVRKRRIMDTDTKTSIPLRQHNSMVDIRHLRLPAATSNPLRIHLATIGHIRIALVLRATTIAMTYLMTAIAPRLHTISQLTLHPLYIPRTLMSRSPLHQALVQRLLVMDLHEQALLVAIHKHGLFLVHRSLTLNQTTSGSDRQTQRASP